MIFLQIRKLTLPIIERITTLSLVAQSFFKVYNNYCFTTSSKIDMYNDHFLFETLMIESTYVCNLTQFM